MCGSSSRANVEPVLSFVNISVRTVTLQVSTEALGFICSLKLESASTSLWHTHKTLSQTLPWAKCSNSPGFASNYCTVGLLAQLKDRYREKRYIKLVYY